jgi:hypothetical protein
MLKYSAKYHTRSVPGAGVFDPRHRWHIAAFDV